MKSLLAPISLAIALCTGSLTVQADTLADIYELSLKNDARLKAAEATFRANIETEKQAFSAMLPQINASAEYSDSDTQNARSSILELNNIQVPSLNDDDTDSDSTTYAVSLNQTLFDLSTWFSFKSGKETTKQAAAQLAFDQQDVIVRVAEAYFNVLRALDNLEASKAEERATKRQLEQTQQRFDVGLIAITDVHEATAVYDTTVVQRLTDEGNLGTSYEALTVLTGQPHANLWLLSKDFPIANPEPMSRDEWVQFALTNNNSLKAAMFAMEAARQNSTSKKMGHAPTITGSITYSDFSEDGTNTSNLPSPNPVKPFETETDGYTWGVRLSVPLYSGGGVSSQRRQAYEQYNVALQNKIEAQRNVIRNARASHITVATDVQRVKARKQSIVSTSSALDATEAGYDVGTRNIVDVLQAQRSLYSAIRDYANSRYDYVLNMLKLKRAAGTLSPQDVYDINAWMVTPGAPTANQYNGYLNR
jgi:outer membrane protein